MKCGDTETTGLPIGRNPSFSKQINGLVVQLSFILYDVTRRRIISTHEYYSIT